LNDVAALCDTVGQWAGTRSIIETFEPFGMFHGYFVYPDVRTSQMMMVAVITSIVFLDDQEFRKRYPNATLMITFFVPIFFFSLIMGSIRSTWLGFSLSILAYAVFFRPRWLIPIVAACVIMLLIGQGTNISSELSSILDFRGNSSNNTRLQLWVAGWDFSEKNLLLGAGVNDIQNQFLDFYNAQPTSYKEDNYLVASSIGNFHNSYLQIFIEWGVLTFGIFVLSGVLLILKLTHALKTTPSKYLVFIRAFLVVSVGYLFSQFFHNELISYSATLYFLLMYSAIYAASISKPDE
jgi:O-antigen ligase